MPYIGQRPATGEANSFKVLDNISTYTLTFDGSSASVVSVANDTITEREHRFVTGQRVTYNRGGGTVITGLSDGVYYISVVDRHTFKLATSLSNANAGTAVNLTGLGVGSSHTLNVAFDGVNTKFKATYNNGTRADISNAPQLMISINGVVQQPHNNTTTPTTGYAVDHTGTIIFSAAPAASEVFFGSMIAESYATFDISDNTIDNFTGNGILTDFTLSKSPPNNESILVTIDGVVQYPDTVGSSKAYDVNSNILSFVSAPGNGVEIQVRHIGFAGAVSGEVTGFYGRTGNAALISTDDIVFNDATASGDIQAANLTLSGNLTVNGTTTTLDTALTEVDKLEVGANNSTAGVAITQSGSGEALTVQGGNTGIGTDIARFTLEVGAVGAASTQLWVNGDARVTGILSVGQGTITLDPAQNMLKLGATTMHQDGSTGDTILMRSGAYNPFRASKFLIDATEVIDNSKVGKNFSKIGIGTAVPTYALQVNDSSIPRIHLTNDTTGTTTSDGFQIYMNGNDAMILNKENSVLQFGTNNATHATLTGDGKLMLGTTTPGFASYGDRFTISTSSHCGMTIRGGSSQDCELFFADATTGAGRYVGGIRYAHATDHMQFTVNAAERLRITSDGNIGIGNDGSIGLYTSTNDRNLILGTGSGSSGIQIHSGTGSWGGIYYGDSTSGTARYAGYVEYNHTNNYLRLATNQVERLRITNDGKVGINKNSPSAILHVAGTNYQTIRLENTDNGANGPYIELFNNSDSPADNDYIGIISFKNNNSADEEITYSQIRAKSVDVTDGSEDGDLTFHTRHQGSFGERLKVSVDQTVGSLETKLDIIGGNVNVGAVDELNGSLRFRSNDASVNNTDNVGAQISAVTEASNGAYVGMSFYSFQQGSRGLAEGFRLDNNGRVVIGTTAGLTGSKLTVAGGCVAITGQNTAHSANSLRLGEEGSGVAQIRAYGPDSSTNGSIQLRVNRSDGLNPKDVTIDSSGRILAGGAAANNAHANADDLILGNTTSGTRTGITLVSGTANDAGLYFSDGNSGTAPYRGQIVYNHNSDSLDLYTAASKRVVLDSNGLVRIGVNAAGGVGTKAANAPLQVDAGSGAWCLQLRMRPSYNDYCYIGFTDDNADEHIGHMFMQRTSAGNGIMVWGTNKGDSSSTDRLKLDNKGGLHLVPDGAGFGNVSTNIAMSIVNDSNAGGGYYPGIHLFSRHAGGNTNGVNGMSIVVTDDNWGLYTRSQAANGASGNRHGLGILTGNSSSSAQAAMFVRSDKKIVCGPSCYDGTSTTHQSHTGLHVAGGGLAVGSVSNGTALEAGRYTLGWYHTTYNGNGSANLHLVTSLWGGGSPSGNTNYIMGGFILKGYYYGQGYSEERIFFHNWSGGLPGYTRVHTGSWNPNNSVYVNSSGYITIKLTNGSYVGYVIDLIQHPWYTAQDIRVTSTTFNSGTNL